MIVVEKTLHPGAAERRERVPVIDTSPCRCEGMWIDIRAEQFPGALIACLFLQFQDQDRQGNHFFARGTARTPDTEFIVVATQKIRKNSILYDLEHVGVAEKLGYTDQEILGEFLLLIRRSAQQVDILIDPRNVPQHHAA